MSLAQYINSSLCGSFTANATSSVSVANTNITGDSVVLLTRATATGTPAGSAYVDTITAGTGFTIKSVASDTNAYKYCILPVYPL